MGMIFTGIIGAIAIAVGVSYISRGADQNFPVWQVYSSSNTRIDDPGHNLVGPAWTGNAEVGAAAAIETEESAT